MRARGASGLEVPPLVLLGTAQAYPGAPISSAQLLQRLEAQFGLSLRRKGLAVARRLHIATRYLARDFSSRIEGTRPDQSNPALAARAVQQALHEAGLTVNDLAYLIGHTATPAEPLPSNISYVASLLQYDGPVAEFRQACTGFVNALVFAAGLCAQGEDRAVAIVGSETGSVFFDPYRARDDTAQLVSMMQMGDGAGAVILRKDQPGHLPRLRAWYHGRLPGQYAPGLRMPAGGSAQPATAQSVLEFEHDFHAIRTHGAELFQAAIAGTRAQAIDFHAIDAVLPHQANGRMDQFLAPYLPPAMRVIVHADQVGNTGSAAIWLGLDYARKHVLTPGQSLLVLGAESTNYSYGGFIYEHV